MTTKDLTIAPNLNRSTYGCRFETSQFAREVSGIDTQEGGEFANVIRSGAIHQIVGQ